MAIYHLQEKAVERILDELVPKYGKPQINLEGSGEPTMAKDLPQYIKVVKKRGLKCFMYCNGARLKGKFMEEVVDAGIDFIRISIIGYNKEKYKVILSTGASGAKKIDIISGTRFIYSRTIGIIIEKSYPNQ